MAEFGFGGIAATEMPIILSAKVNTERLACFQREARNITCQIGSDRGVSYTLVENSTKKIERYSLWVMSSTLGPW